MRSGSDSCTADLLVISICGFICGIDNWVELEEFGEIKKDWFKEFLELPNGIPSHDTFGRFYAALDPEEFSRCFTRWVQAIGEVTEGEVVPVDGKTLRRSFDRASSKAAIHMVSAWASKTGLVLGQEVQPGRPRAGRGDGGSMEGSGRRQDEGQRRGLG